MPQCEYRGRRAAFIENDLLRVTVLAEGGHIAGILDRQTGINPLWAPPWPSIEPSAFDPVKNPGYGGNAESRLLAGIMGHNLCLDLFGVPSPEEAAAGLTVHGEASVAVYDLDCGASELRMSACFAQSQLAFERRIALDGRVLEITETVENLAAADRPIGWTQHVTLGPPFLAKGATEFRASATRSKVFESLFTDGHDYMKPAAEFDWPSVPQLDGGCSDLRTFTNLPVSGGFTTHLMDPARAEAFFVAWSPASQMAIGYAWRRSDFPWLGIWEENYSRAQPPWNGQSLTRGMEFGASPMPETRRAMIERGKMFGAPCFCWIPARSKVRVEYRAAFAPAAKCPEALLWSAEGGVRFA